MRYLSLSTIVEVEACGTGLAEVLMVAGQRGAQKPAKMFARTIPSTTTIASRARLRTSLPGYLADTLADQGRGSLNAHPAGCQEGDEGFGVVAGEYPLTCRLRSAGESIRWGSQRSD